MNHATPAVGPNTAISPEVVSHVKAVAASMIGHAAFQKCDFDDICQELFQQIILATPKFNPEKSSFDTYACLIADRYKNRIYRVRIHEKRDVPTIPFENNGDEPSQYEIDTACNHVEQAMFRNDVLLFVAKLPEKQRRFCENVMDGLSNRQAAKMAGIQWGYEYQNLIKRLRFKLKNVGF